MKLLIIKTSSLGDIIHTLPILDDLKKKNNDLTIDWIIEENYVDLLMNHEHIESVIPVSIRRWRGGLYRYETWREILNFIKISRKVKYDFIIDIQGLFKSAIISIICRGKRIGFDNSSSREPVDFFYNKSYKIPKQMHALTRNRLLVSKIFQTDISSEPVYRFINNRKINSITPKAPYCIFFHGSSNSSKLWSQSNWVEVGHYLNSLKLNVLLPHGNFKEKKVCKFLNKKILFSQKLSTLKISALVCLIENASIIIGLDTGLTHLSVAMKKPTIGIYINSSISLTGLYNNNYSVNLDIKKNETSAKDVINVIKKLLKT